MILKVKIATKNISQILNVLVFEKAHQKMVMELKTLDFFVVISNKAQPVINHPYLFTTAIVIVARN